MSVTLVFGQQTEVVYLKNGSVIKGVVIEQNMAEKSIKLQTSDGSIFVYKMEDIDKIEKPEETQAQPQQQPTQKSKASKAKPQSNEPKPEQKKFEFSEDNLKYGVKAGLNFSRVSYLVSEKGEEEDEGEYVKMKPGINLGVFANYSFTPLIAVETGFNIETKGYKFKYEEGNKERKAWGCYEEKVNVVYATIPADFKLNFDKFYVFVGNYIGIGVTGKNKWNDEEYEKGELVKNDGKDKIKFASEWPDDDDDDNTYLKRFDLGYRIGGGYEINDNLGVRISYDFGVLNTASEYTHSSYSYSETKKNRTFSISATWRLK